jgi:hypothetical protein
MRPLLTFLLIAHILPCLAQRFDARHPPNTYRNADNPHYRKNRPPYADYWQQDVHYLIKARLDDERDVANGELGGRDDVRRGRVDNHHPGGGCRFDIDIVETHAGARNHLEVGSGGNHLGVNLCGAAHENGSGRLNRLEKCRAIGSVNRAHIEVGAERLNGGGRQLFGNHNDGLSHVGVSLYELGQDPQKCVSRQSNRRFRWHKSLFGAGPARCSGLPPSRGHIQGQT